MIGDYPTQLDEIDQWLNDNFGILPGACSSTENLRYSVARRVAEALWPKTKFLPSDVDLEEEIGKVFFSRRFEDEHGRFSIQLSLEEFSDIAKHFAEWQKEQMEA